MISSNLVKATDAVLLPRGFARRELVWNRRRAGFIDVVDLQMSQSMGSFTINIGVFDPVVHQTIWNQRPAEFVEEPSCTARCRLGALVDGRDRWWNTSDCTAVAEIGHLLTLHGIPFLEAINTRDDMEAILFSLGVVKRRHPVPIISLAILKMSNGRTAEGLQLLRDLQSKTSQPWRDRIAAIVQRTQIKTSAASDTSAP